MSDAHVSRKDIDATATDRSASTAGGGGGEETFAFQAEINQLMSLIINTFYSNKEIWLRELLSNASDALDKMRYLSLTTSGKSREEVLKDVPELRIRIECDNIKNTVSITDTGIGMTKSDLVQNLGTIAKSGTKGFMEALSAGSVDLSMIGQFGVGFYSSYLVADRVTVVTKHPDDDRYEWKSEAGGTFTITRSEDDTLPRGTRITLHLKDDQTEYAETRRIMELVRKHSEFIGYPIELSVEETVTKEKEEEEEEEEKKEGDDGKDTTATTVQSWQLLNRTKPVWTRSPDEVSAEEYSSFYKGMTNDWEDPLAVKHFCAEGQLEFRGLLFLPAKAPFDMFDSGPQKKMNNIRLHVRRVFVTDDAEGLIPDYLSFVKGIVDSDDLPLNISRETLQQSSVVKIIRKTLIKKCLEMFSDVASRGAEDYARFYDAFGKHIKLGTHSDAPNRGKLAEFLRFHSSRTYFGGGAESVNMTGLRDYITRMKEGQSGIFYITGENVQAVQKSPFLERIKCKGYEVLFMVDPIDEYVFQVLKEFEGKPFVDCSKEGLDLEDGSEEEKAVREKLTNDFRDTCLHMKEVLGDRVEKVVVGHRIVDSPCVLVTGDYGWSANMERIMKAQVMQDGNLANYMVSKKTMEINPAHALMRDMKRRSDEQRKYNKTDSAFRDMCMVLYETALLTSGFSMQDPHVYAARVYRMLCAESELNDAGDSNEQDGIHRGTSSSKDGQVGTMEEVD